MMNTLNKENFPELLKEIPDPPTVLYIEGILPNPETKLLCVVGSRNFTAYGKEVCESLIKGLRGYDIAIVSGLALGIDGIAHRAALDADLKTIAVPGSGLDPGVLYPSSHRELAKKILDAGGCLLSEFPPEHSAAPWTFPQRNRIMAGLSHAVLVIEAEIKSGTLITSKLATEYNRDVCTVPASIFSKTSEGPHMLMRIGATPIRNSQDILEVLGFDSTPQQQKIDLHNLSAQELKVIEVLHSPLSRDELLSQLNMPISQSNALLSMMEIKGIIKESMGEIHLHL